MPYATVDELADRLNVDPVERAEELYRVLDAATLEINSELGRSEPLTDPSHLALVHEVNLERALEHWRQSEVGFGLVAAGTDVSLPAFAASDTWNRHAHKLAPLKETWGFA